MKFYYIKYYIITYETMNIMNIIIQTKYHCTIVLTKLLINYFYVFKYYIM